MEHGIPKGFIRTLFWEIAHNQLKKLLQYIHAIREASTQLVAADQLTEMLPQVHTAFITALLVHLFCWDPRF